MDAKVGYQVKSRREQNISSCHIAPEQWSEAWSHHEDKGATVQHKVLL